MGISRRKMCSLLLGTGFTLLILLLISQLIYLRQVHSSLNRGVLSCELSFGQDDPADYSFFFDTSSRRTCYIAPERFYKAGTDIDQKMASPMHLTSTSYLAKVTLS